MKVQSFAKIHFILDPRESFRLMKKSFFQMHELNASTLKFAYEMKTFSNPQPSNPHD